MGHADRPLERTLGQEQLPIGGLRAAVSSPSGRTGPWLDGVRSRGRIAGVSLLAKPTGAVCNLDFSYCFFLSKELLHPGSRFKMAEELLENYIRQLIEAHARSPIVQVA